MKIQNDINLLRIVLKEPDKNFLSKIKSIESPTWVVKRTDDATDTDKVFYLYKDLVDSKILDLFSELDTTRKVDFIENWRVNPSTYSITSNVIYGVNPNSELEELDLGDVDFENEEALKLIDEKLKSLKPQNFENPVESESNEENTQDKEDFSDSSDENLDNDLEIELEEELEEDSLQNDFDENLEEESEDDLLSDDFENNLDDFDENLSNEEEINSFKIFNDDMELKKIENVSLTKEQLIETIIPNAENLLDELTPTLELKNTNADSSAVLLKGQYETSLMGIHMLFSDSILSIDSNKLEKDVEKIKSTIETDELPSVKEYFNAYEEKKQFMDRLEAEANAIKDSYRARMDAYVNEITILAMKKFMEENPDDSPEKIATLYRNSAKKQHELQLKSEKAQSIAQKEVLSHILKSNKKDKALLDAMKFMSVKQNFQAKLDESIDVLARESSINKVNANNETLQLLQQIRNNQEKPQVVTKEVVKEVPVEVIKEVVKEVPVEVIKEVVKEVPVEVIKEVPINQNHLNTESEDINNLNDNVQSNSLDNEQILSDDIDKNADINDKVENLNNKVENPNDNLEDLNDKSEDSILSNAPSAMHIDYEDEDFGEAEDFDESLFDEDSDTMEVNDDNVITSKGKKSSKKKLLGKKGLIGLGLAGAIAIGGGIGAYSMLGSSNKAKQPPQPKVETNQNKEDDKSKENDKNKKSTEGDVVVGTVFNITSNGKQIEATVEKIEPNGDVILHDKEGKKYKVSAAKLAEFKKNQEENK